MSLFLNKTCLISANLQRVESHFRAAEVGLKLEERLVCSESYNYFQIHLCILLIFVILLLLLL